MKFVSDSNGADVEITSFGSVTIENRRFDHIDAALKGLERMREVALALHDTAMKADTTYAQETTRRRMNEAGRVWQDLKQSKIKPGTDAEIAEAMKTWKAAEVAYVAAGGVIHV